MDGPGILIVEDESIVAMELEMRLEGLGYRPHPPVDTGEEAVEKALELRPDVILMDVRLRGQIDGIEAARRIREHLDVPIIFLSAFTDRDTLESTAALGVAHLQKPFEDNELRAALRKALGT